MRLLAPVTAMAAVVLALGTTGALATPVSGTPFPATSGTVRYLDDPSVNTTSSTTSGTVQFTDDGDAGQNSSFRASNGYLYSYFGGGSKQDAELFGTLAFSKTVGDIVTEAVGKFLGIPDDNGGSFFFDVASVTTQSYVVQVGTTSIGLYALGQLYDNNLNLQQTAASLTITLNQTGSSNYSASATLSNPPANTIPEPATLAVLATGLIGIGMVRRRTI